MDGKGMEAVRTYLSRLTGEPVAAGGLVRLRSVQRAAFSSWARQNGVAIRTEVISSGTPFSLEELVQGESESLEIPSALQLPLGTKMDITAPVTGTAVVGIDIEDVDSMPHADDYREHPFYQDNFTPAEIAYCVLQANVRASFCGTWAAKEAILKTGMISASKGHLRGIEVARDAVGRPTYPRCSLSISHTASTAVAVCSATPA